MDSKESSKTKQKRKENPSKVCSLLSELVWCTLLKEQFFNRFIFAIFAGWIICNDSSKCLKLRYYSSSIYSLFVSLSLSLSLSLISLYCIHFWCTNKSEDVGRKRLQLYSHPQKSASPERDALNQRIFNFVIRFHITFLVCLYDTFIYREKALLPAFWFLRA